MRSGGAAAAFSALLPAESERAPASCLPVRPRARLSVWPSVAQPGSPPRASRRPARSSPSCPSRRSVPPRISVPLARQGPSPRLLSPHLCRSVTRCPSRFPRTGERASGGREHEAASPSPSSLSPSPDSPSLSLRAGLRVSSCLTAPTCPSLCHSQSPRRPPPPSQPARVVPGSRAPLSPPPRAPALPHARLLPAAPAASGPRLGWRQRAGGMWRGSCSAGRLQSPTRHAREMAAAGRLRGPGLGHGARPELAELELGHPPGALGARGAIRPPAVLLRLVPG